MNYKYILILLLVVVGCSASFVLVNKPENEVNIDVLQSSTIDSVGIGTEALKRSVDKTKNKLRNKKPAVDSTGFK